MQQERKVFSFFFIKSKLHDQELMLSTEAASLFVHPVKLLDLLNCMLIEYSYYNSAPLVKLKHDLLQQEPL